MANKSITQLQPATTLTGMEAIPLVQNGVTKQALAVDIAALRVPLSPLTFGAGMVPGTYDGDLPKTVALQPTGVVPNTYGDSTHVSQITVNQYGQITNAIDVQIAGGGGGSVTIANDTTTNSAEFPLFVNTTSGTASTVYTSSPNYTYNPATGELSAPVIIATNGIFVNAQNVSQNYTIESGFNGVSGGPITVDGGVTVTVVDGEWTVVPAGLPVPFGVSGDVLVSTGAATAPTWAPVDGGSF